MAARKRSLSNPDCSDQPSAKRQRAAKTKAEKLLSFGAKEIVNSAGTDQEHLNALIKFAESLNALASKRLKEVRRADKDCGCGVANASQHCSGCDVPLCEECIESCGECNEPQCNDCADNLNICNFDDGLGGKGCGRLICEDCYVTTPCCREVGGCQECLDEYDCPDCDQCNYW